MLTMSTDPSVLIPGSPVSIQQAIAGWKGRANRADQNALSLRAFAAPEGWEGSAPRAFRRHVEKVAASWTLLQNSLTVASGALQEYSSTLDWARDQAGVAIDTWIQAERAESQVSMLPAPSPSAFDASALRTKAWEILRHAQSRVAEAGDRAAGIIRTAAAQPTLSAETWQRMGQTVTTSAQAAALLSSLSPAELDDVLTARPELVDLVKALDTEAAKTWWSALAPAAQSALIRTLPGVIGNLEGVPYGARDKANRRALTSRLAEVEKELSDALKPLPESPPPTAEEMHERHLREQSAREDLAALEGVRDGLKTDPDRPPRFLVSLTDDHPPLAAVSIGDLDTADNITVAVPGMTSEAAGMREWADSVSALQEMQAALDASRQHAVVAWIGYKAPPSPQDGDFAVLGNELAEEGAARLNKTLHGLTCANSESSLNVVAHSYGTTTSSIALASTDVRIDAFVAIGSAGLPTTINDASDLNADKVFAGQARSAFPLPPVTGDEWAWIGRKSLEHPIDPMNPTFGAHTFGTDSARGELAPVESHVTNTPRGEGYLDQHTESLRNIAMATVGQGEAVTPARGWISENLR
ncbi:alpha/beta hydrolase [Microbacterium sp. PRF11]|uniref:alpha/beta hydrolase n=1 Tax=Microbacterium sp. PRF11 TaxID=2962593 RepID=UPI0028827810|nr:alpha/beta hydrolase [Microbacterium sp. PRF11]MDT0117747.1 alpha/beta hydrolase [Microbacterium sp. PRF11]